MKNYIMKITTIVMIVLLIGTIGATTASAAGFFTYRKGMGYNNLIEKWEEIQNEKQELRDMLESYGIDLPDLTKEQKRDITSTIRESKRNGLSREEIRDNVVELLIDFGVDLPGLTIEQRAEIRLKIKEMLEENYGFIFIELTPEQKAYIKQSIIQMKKQGVSKEDIKTTVIDLYESYGGVIPELNDGEKEDIHDWIMNMLETNYGLDLPNLTVEQRNSITNKKDEIQQLRNDLKILFRDANRITRWRFLRYVHKDLTS
jgi:hypothetical protein